ncbi:MAG: xanthine dehydrogenase family protein molybdopterin-binding subunit [Gemmatimonadetes bacterium]|nr:xanthine dehydrogenase family protein molybdopterin-binding subunit [Gemmatimonadota bacterium]
MFTPGGRTGIRLLAYRWDRNIRAMDILRREGLAKLSGSERYVDDLALDDFLWGGTVRSTIPRGRLRGIRFPDWFDDEDFVVVRAADIPGRNSIYLKTHDQPALVESEIRHAHEPVLLLAHESRSAVRRAVAEIEVIAEPLDPWLDYVADPPPEMIQHGDDNVFKRIDLRKGDVEAALATAPIVVEGVYETSAQEHIYIEPQGMTAHVEDGLVVVRGSMQCPFYVEKALCNLLGRPESGVRVVQTPTGGGFGGKEEYPSMIAGHAALLTLEAGRPVKLVYERAEDMAATTKRHPSRIRHRTGVDEDGKLLAQEIDVRLDGGAYLTLSPVVLSRACIHAAGPYACDHVRISGTTVLTNRVPYGAFRGFGNPQACFAFERQMDAIARRLGIDPIELRRRNLIRDGESTATGHVITDGTDRVALLDRAVALADVRAKRAAHVTFNARTPDARRGVGVVTYHHGAGFTGAGEVEMDSRVHVVGRRDGIVEVRAASTEMGQGTITVFTQLAAERLGLAPDQIVIAPPDTRRVPNSGPTVASRTAMIVGHLVERGCDDLRHEVGLTDEARGPIVRDAILAWHDEHDEDVVVGEGRYVAPPGIEWNEETYEGAAYGAYCWAAHVADVEVDLRTFGVRVLDYVAVQEVGRVLNEVLARGQIQGGVVQGIGWALLEECVERDGAMVNTQLTNYIIPTSGDVPPIRVDFLENPYPHGAGGAKGLGEFPLNGPAPAIGSAIASALGVEPCAIPFTPERLLRLAVEARVA